MKINRFTLKAWKPNVFGRFIANWLNRYLQQCPFLYCNRKDDIVIGRNVSLANVILNARSGKITIGKRVMFGHDCMVLTGYHEVYSHDGLRPVREYGKDIIIEDDVWIASGAMILGPCRIGKGSVIAAGAVVTHDVPAGVMVGGVPARFIRKLEPLTMMLEVA